MYEKVEDQLEKAIKSLHISLKGKKVLDARAGIGLFTNFYQKRGATITAVDVSKEALAILKKKYPRVETEVSSLEDFKRLKKKKSYVVHCFDVLYHITDDDSWEKAVENLARASEKYIFIHIIADRWDNFLERRHVRTKRRISLEKKMELEGFKEIASYPTHYLYVKAPFYFFVNYMADFLKTTDDILTKIKLLKPFATTYIRIYKRKNVN